MAVLSSLAAVCLIICSCNPAPGTGSGQPPADTEPGWRIGGELVRSGDKLRYEDGGQTAWERPAEDVTPYQVVSGGPPALLTAVNTDLKMTTWALGDEPRAYPQAFPLLSGSGWSVLSRIPGDSVESALAVTVLDAQGEPAWSSESAQALWPEAVAGGNDTLYLAVAGEIGLETNELIFPLGQNPALAAVALSGGAELWRREIPTEFPVADLQLIALGEGHGLLSLQYDYQIIELVAYSTADGRITGRQRIEGLTAQRLVYPGPEGEYLKVEVSGDRAKLLVLMVAQGLVGYEVDLAAGSFELTKAGAADSAAREENTLSAGGTGTPGPELHPFGQDILPTAAGDTWRIPALLTPGGSVVVIVNGEVVFLDELQT